MPLEQVADFGPCVARQHELRRYGMASVAAHTPKLYSASMLAKRSDTLPGRYTLLSNRLEILTSPLDEALKGQTSHGAFLHNRAPPYLRIGIWNNYKYEKAKNLH